jgi:two-component system, chemotaxis family, chemotaxis protein CheY
VKALIAEDSQIMRKIVKTNLAKLSISKVYEAADGESALNILNANPSVEIVFTDINMPSMNGIELCRKIRSQQKFEHVKIIVISEHISETAKEALSELKVNGYVPKPFDLKTFNDTVIPIIEAKKNGVHSGESGVDISRGDLVKKIQEETPLITLDAEELTISFNKMSLTMSVDKLLEFGKIKSDEEKKDYVELKDK